MWGLPPRAANSRFSSRRLRQAGVPEENVAEYQDRADRLLTLQLLAGDFADAVEEAPLRGATCATVSYTGSSLSIPSTFINL